MRDDYALILGVCSILPSSTPVSSLQMFRSNREKRMSPSSYVHFKPASEILIGSCCGRYVRDQGSIMVCLEIKTKVSSRTA